MSVKKIDKRLAFGKVRGKTRDALYLDAVAKVNVRYLRTNLQLIYNKSNSCTTSPHQSTKPTDCCTQIHNKSN